MNKTELINKIRKYTKQIYAGTSPTKKEPLTSKYFSKFEILNKFPQLDNELIKLMTPQYGEFIKEIDWVAPRPTTFRIKLQNDQFFYLIYGEKSWIAQIEGKKYWLLSLPEEERAAISLARILRYGGEDKPDEKEINKEIPTKKEKTPLSGKSKEEVPDINPEEFETDTEEIPA
jgi:hypothetical protein